MADDSFTVVGWSREYMLKRFDIIGFAGFSQYNRRGEPELLTRRLFPEVGIVPGRSRSAEEEK